MKVLRGFLVLVAAVTLAGSVVLAASDKRDVQRHGTGGGCKPTQTDMIRAS